VPRTAQTEIETLKRLTTKGCTATPVFLGSKSDKQDANMPFQGGFVVYVAMSTVPGVCFNQTEFWNKDKTWRDGFRSAFKAAWE
jgi:hypothetical protein